MAKTIMVVDDSSSVRYVVKAALKGAGYEVVEACDGQEALLKLPEQKVDLIVSDVNMPKMDGIRLVKEVKKLPDYQSIPVFLLTSNDEQEKIKEGKAAGAQAWIIKPFEPPKFLKMVSNLIQ